ncbi:MAG TPA: hypothetical protein DDW62_09515 [Marinilabiliaceae bacterium]|jgi:hypothetical protein|nr:hypothetical protein [Marinilabiliaceae bacterium]
MIFFVAMIDRLKRVFITSKKDKEVRFNVLRTEEKETEAITRLKRKIFIYSVVEVVIVLVLIAFGTFLFSITLS